jgi:hypothetical protein
MLEPRLPLCQALRSMPTYSGGVATTHRIDNWWVAPSATAAGLVLFFGYLTYRAFNPSYVFAEPYISPTVAPPLFTSLAGVYAGSVPVSHAWLGAFPAWWPAFLPQSPAFFFPGLAIAFRFTCYYYRGAYYKAFFVTPPACSVKGIQKNYRGEKGLLILQNLHRYALYGALFLLVCLWTEGIMAFFKNGQLGIGVGTVVMVINASLLTGYTFGCHSWRHLIAGRMDCFACDNVGKTTMRYGAYQKSTWLNMRHQLFAWMSLVWVAFTDLYIYLVSSGTIRDLNTWS